MTPSAAQSRADAHPSEAAAAVQRTVRRFPDKTGEKPQTETATFVSEITRSKTRESAAVDAIGSPA
jgi:hypothetical protein